MSLSISAILGWQLYNFPWFFDWRHFPPKVYGRERFDLPHQQQDYILRPRESICWNSPCLISPAQRPIEDLTYMLFGYQALNEQPLLARLRPAGVTERNVDIAEWTKQFVLCKSIRPDFTLTFRLHIPVLFGVEIGSRNYRKLSRSTDLQKYSASVECMLRIFFGAKAPHGCPSDPTPKLKTNMINLGNDDSISSKVIRTQTEQFLKLFSRIFFFAP